MADAIMSCRHMLSIHPTVPSLSSFFACPTRFTEEIQHRIETPIKSNKGRILCIVSSHDNQEQSKRSMCEGESNVTVLNSLI